MLASIAATPPAATTAADPSAFMSVTLSSASMPNSCTITTSRCACILATTAATPPAATTAPTPAMSPPAMSPPVMRTNAEMHSCCTAATPTLCCACMHVTRRDTLSTLLLPTFIMIPQGDCIHRETARVGGAEGSAAAGGSTGDGADGGAASDGGTVASGEAQTSRPVDGAGDEAGRSAGGEVDGSSGVDEGTAVPIGARASWPAARRAPPPLPPPPLLPPPAPLHAKRCSA